MSRWRVSRGIQRSFTRSYQASLFSPSSKGLTFTYLSSPIKLTKLGFFSRDTDPGAVLPLPPGEGAKNPPWKAPSMGKEGRGSQATPARSARAVQRCG